MKHIKTNRVVSYLWEKSNTTQSQKEQNIYIKSVIYIHSRERWNHKIILAIKKIAVLLIHHFGEDIFARLSLVYDFGCLSPVYAEFVTL